MKLLIVGAGASYGEAASRGLPEEMRPPLMKNFAVQMWRDYNPHFLLASYLKTLRVDPGPDARAAFLRLEACGKANVEEFFEFAFQNAGLVLPGNAGFDPASEYHNLLCHGILNPLVFLLVEGLLKDSENPDLPLSASVAAQLRSGDMVVNLNYDPIFEIAARQVGHDLVFLPNKVRPSGIKICKPHGSMNLLATERGFYFAEPLFAGSVQPSDGSRNYIALVPPRLHKHYTQHWISAAILHPTRALRPSRVIFWGVGLTQSDIDLLKLYRRWCAAAQAIEFINPSTVDAQRAEALLGRELQHFTSVEEWLIAAA